MPTGEPTAGYNCTFCGQWVQSGIAHQCWVTGPTVPPSKTYSAFLPTTVYSGVDYEKIREIVREEIAKALADQKLLEKWSK